MYDLDEVRCNLMKKSQFLLFFLVLCLLNINTVKASEKLANTIVVDKTVVEENTAVLDKVDEDIIEIDLFKNRNISQAPNAGADNIEKTPLLYKDVKVTDWAYQALDELSTKYKVLKGMPNGNFEGKRAATRYEMAQSLVNTIQEMEKEHIQLSAIEKAAIKSLKDEFDKEIIALAARVEFNETRIEQLDKKHEGDVVKLDSDISSLKKRHHFVPEMRFRYGLGDVDPGSGTHASTRLRLTSISEVNKDTVGVIRLEATTNNLINLSERNGDIVDTDLTLAYVHTGSLTRWIPKKAGTVKFIGGILPPSWLFYTKNMTANVDQRGFNDANPSFSLFNTQILAFHRDLPNGRRMTIGGDYTKKFDSHNARIDAMVLRSTGGSLDTPGNDISSSGDESTYYAVSAESDLPGTKRQPVNLKVSHAYSFGDNATHRRTYSIGGRLATKFNGFGVVKAAVIGHNGTVPPLLLEGLGGQGFSYQLAFNPTIKAFGNFFGDPDKITHLMPCYVPGKTEVGVGFANYHNDQDESIRALDVYVSRYFGEHLFGRILFSHVNPNVRVRGLSARSYVLFETIFKL